MVISRVHINFQDKLGLTKAAGLVIGLGLGLRLFAFFHTTVISPDGVFFIHQARIIYYGLKDSVNSLGLVYLSNYPLFIAGVYTIVGDWVASAKLVSLFFGTLTLVPLYLLSRRFFD